MAQQDRPASEDARSAQPASDPIAHARLPYSPEDFRNEIRRVKRKRRLVVVLCIVLFVLAAAVAVAVVLFKLPSSLVTVDSDDMAPVLEKGQVVYVQQASLPVDNAVVAYRDADGAVQVKRVVAVAGEWVNVASDGTVIVGAVPMEGSSAAGVAGDDATVVAARQVPDGSCFVIADAESNALDALYRPESYVSGSQIVGTVAARMWPLASIGPVS